MALKEYHKVDMTTGERLEVHILNDETDTIPDDYKLGWGGTDRAFHDAKWDFNLNDWVEGADPAVILQDFKNVKMEELKKACSNSILGTFPYDVDGVTYYFSCDTEAQSNFEKVDRSFEKGRMTSIGWTAYDTNGNVVRITFDATSFEPFYVAQLNHIQGNISKLRDTLQPQVDAAQSREELDAIQW